MKGDRMEKGLKGYRPLLLLLLCGGMTLKAAAQAAITDPLNTAQSTLTAGNTAATGETGDGIGEQAPDRPGLCPEGVRHRQTRTDVHGPDRPAEPVGNGNYLRTLEEAEKMDMKGLPGITSAVQDVVANNAAIISLTMDILGSDLKMNDSGRIKHLRKCLEKLREQEAGLSAIRQTISRTRTIRRNLGLVTK